MLKFVIIWLHFKVFLMGKCAKPRQLAWHIVFVKIRIDNQKYITGQDPHCTVICLEIPFSKTCIV